MEYADITPPHIYIMATQTTKPDVKKDATKPDVSKPETEQKPDEKKKPVYESEQLTKLRTQEAELTDKMFSLGKTPESKKIILELWTIGQSIENEISAIKKRHADLEKETRNNAIIAGFWAMFPLWDAKNAADAKLSEIPVESRTDDNMVYKGLLVTANDAKTALDNVAEPIINRLLGSVPKPATTSGGAATTSGGKGKIGQEIRDIIAPMYATKTGAEIRAHVIKTLGYNDGTANGIIKAYEVENKLNGN